MLCELALGKENCKLVELNLEDCPLTDECIPDLRKTLQDVHCRLNKLTLPRNKFTEEGKNFIREIATHEQCKHAGTLIQILVAYFFSLSSVKNMLFLDKQRNTFDKASTFLLYM